MTAQLFVMLRDPFVGTGSPAPLRRRLGGEGVCVPKLEDGHLMVFNPLNPGDRPAAKMVPEAPQSQRLAGQSGLGGTQRRSGNVLFATWRCAQFLCRVPGAI